MLLVFSPYNTLHKVQREILSSAYVFEFAQNGELYSSHQEDLGKLPKNFSAATVKQNDRGDIVRVLIGNHSERLESEPVFEDANDDGKSYIQKVVFDKAHRSTQFAHVADWLCWLKPRGTVIKVVNCTSAKNGEKNP